MTLYALVSGLPIINGRNDADILSTIDAGGLWTITLTPADNAMVGSDAGLEQHRILLEWTYGAGAKAGKHEIDFPVRNLDKVP